MTRWGEWGFPFRTNAHESIRMLVQWDEMDGDASTLVYEAAVAQALAYVIYDL